MRDIEMIIVHASDSDNPKHDSINVVRDWHVTERKFTDVGYHWFIRSTGELQAGRPEHIAGAHCEGHNKASIGICLHGKGEPTQAQKHTLETLLIEKCSQYDLEKSDIYPHNHFNKGKTCPNWPLEKWLDSRSWH